jgi:hypothetical protein
MSVHLAVSLAAVQRVHSSCLRQVAMTGVRRLVFNLFKSDNFVSECYISLRHFCGDLKFKMKKIAAHATVDSQTQSLQD